jgi:hypothetical protein
LLFFVLLCTCINFFNRVCTRWYKPVIPALRRLSQAQWWRIEG